MPVDAKEGRRANECERNAFTPVEASTLFLLALPMAAMVRIGPGGSRIRWCHPTDKGVRVVTDRVVTRAVVMTMVPRLSVAGGHFDGRILVVSSEEGS